MSGRRTFLSALVGGVAAGVVNIFRPERADAADGTFDNLVVGPSGSTIWGHTYAGKNYVQINGSNAAPLGVNQRGTGAGGNQTFEVGERVVTFRGPAAAATSTQWDSQAEIVLSAGRWDGTQNVDQNLAIGAQADPDFVSAMLVFDIPGFGEVTRLRYPGVYWLNQVPGATDGFVVAEDSWGRMGNYSKDGARWGPKGGPEDAGIVRIAAKTVAVVGEGFQLGKVASLPCPSVTYRGQVLRTEGNPDKVYVCIKGTGASYSWKQIA